jgi:hypothetical protein
MTKELLNEIQNDYWNEKADPIDMAEVFDLAIKTLEQEQSGKKTYKSETRRWKRRYLDLKQRIFKLEEQTRWIPVSERLPEDNIHVLCQFYLGGMGECYLAHGAFHVVGGLVMTCNEVIAWMPLPQPYNVESEE